MALKLKLYNMLYKCTYINEQLHLTSYQTFKHEVTYRSQTYFLCQQGFPVKKIHRRKMSFDHHHSNFQFCINRIVRVLLILIRDFSVPLLLLYMSHDFF